MVLLLDEPSSGFDASSRKSLISTSCSVLLTTHSIREADGLADRAGMMSGRILTLGTPRGLRRRWGDM